MLSRTRRIRRGHRLLGLAGRRVGPEFHNAQGRWCPERPTTTVIVVSDTIWLEPPDHGVTTPVSTLDNNAPRRAPRSWTTSVVNIIVDASSPDQDQGGRDDSDVGAAEATAHVRSARAGQPDAGPAQSTRAGLVDLEILRRPAHRNDGRLDRRDPEHVSGIGCRCRGTLDPVARTATTGGALGVPDHGRRLRRQ